MSFSDKNSNYFYQHTYPTLPYPNRQECNLINNPRRLYSERRANSHSKSKYGWINKFISYLERQSHSIIGLLRRRISAAKFLRLCCVRFFASDEVNHFVVERQLKLWSHPVARLRTR